MGPPVRWNGPGDDSSDLRQFTDQVMDAIAVLSGQQRADHYARRDRGRLSAPGSEAEPVPPDGPAPRAATV